MGNVPPPGHGWSGDHLCLTVAEEGLRRRRGSENKGIKNNDAILHFSNMDNESIREQEEITNLRSAVPPAPLRVGSIIIRQPG